MRILIVDDDMNSLLTLQKMLAKTDHETLLVQDSRNALTLVEHKDYDAVIINVKMPHVSGAEIIEKACRRGLKTMIIAMTGGASTDTLAEIRQKTPFILFKPFSQKDLLDLLDGQTDGAADNRPRPLHTVRRDV